MFLNLFALTKATYLVRNKRKLKTSFKKIHKKSLPLLIIYLLPSSALNPEACTTTHFIVSNGLNACHVYARIKLNIKPTHPEAHESIHLSPQSHTR